MVRKLIEVHTKSRTNIFVHTPTHDDASCMSVKLFHFFCSVSRLLSSHQKISSSIHQQSRRSLPVCTIETNIASANLPRDVHYEFEKLMAKTFNKPQSVSGIGTLMEKKLLIFIPQYGNF